jgi:hypothetical protein
MSPDKQAASTNVRQSHRQAIDTETTRTTIRRGPTTPPEEPRAT